MCKILFCSHFYLCLKKIPNLTILVFYYLFIYSGFKIITQTKSLDNRSIFIVCYLFCRGRQLFVLIQLNNFFKNEAIRISLFGLPIFHFTFFSSLSHLIERHIQEWNFEEWMWQIYGVVTGFLSTLFVLP